MTIPKNYNPKITFLATIVVMPMHNPFKIFANNTSIEFWKKTFLKLQNYPNVLKIDKLDYQKCIDTLEFASLCEASLKSVKHVTVPYDNSLEFIFLFKNIEQLSAFKKLLNDNERKNCESN